MSGLTQGEMARYQRHLTLPGFGAEAQGKLKRARVLVIGAGGLGCPALQYLAAAGVGALGIIDDDVVARSNLQRQVLFTEADVGRLKAEVAAERLRAMNPLITCHARTCRLSADNALELFEGYDVILDGSDNFPTRYLVNDACVLTGKPLIYGAIHTFEGQVSVFNYRGGPTYRCLFPEPPDPGDVPNCSEIGVLGVLPGLIGVIQATEAIKLLTDTGEPLSGKLLMLDALTMEQRTVRFDRAPENADVRELREIDYACSVPAADDSDEITPEELRERLTARDNLQIIDVREDWERAICSIESAHYPLGELLAGRASMESSGLSKDAPTCVFCKVGARSLAALPVLREHYGFSDVKSLQGGIKAWAERVDPEAAVY